MASASKKVATSIAALAWHRHWRGVPRAEQRSRIGGRATPASTVAERGRKLAEAVDRIFADIYSASEATRSGADEAQ